MSSSQFTSFFNFSATQRHPQFPVPQREWGAARAAPRCLACCPAATAAGPRCWSSQLKKGTAPYAAAEPPRSEVDSLTHNLEYQFIDLPVRPGPTIDVII